MRFFTNAVARMYELPIRTSAKMPEIGVNNIVEVLSDDGTFLEVIYNTRHGFILNTLAEPYIESLPKDCVRIDNQTPELTDFEQYIILNGIKQVNLCGELSICYALGKDLKDLMSKWEISAPSLWSRIKGGGRFSGTHWQDLDAICDIYEANARPLAEVMKDPNLNRSRYTPASLEKAAEDGYPIIGCRMNPVTGRLNGGGIGHWVVIERVEPERFGGQVFLYNPAPNRIEQYSYEAFLASAPQPFGLWIPKEED